MKEFLFGNVQIEFKSQGLLYKVLCTELRTPHKTQSYLHYHTKMIIWEWWRERERYRDERDWWNPIYKPVLCISPLLYVSLSICASLFCSLYVFAVCVFALFFYICLFFLSPPSSFFLLAEGSLFIEKFEKLLPPFFVPQPTG